MATGSRRTLPGALTWVNTAQDTRAIWIVLIWIKAGGLFERSNPVQSKSVPGIGVSTDWEREDTYEGT